MMFAPIRLDTILDFADVQQGMRVADFCAGRGHVTQALAQRVGAAGRVFAIDESPQWFSKLHSSAADAMLENIRTAHIADIHDTHALPEIPSYSLDMIFIVNAHSPGATNALIATAARLLQPHGTLILGDLNNHSANPYAHLRAAVPRHAAFRAAHEHGFTLIDECAPSSYHYALKMARGM